ncbi:MAG: helix-hairpin-helix domain-containing protein [Phycisphaeraceae bacterium]
MNTPPTPSNARWHARLIVIALLLLAHTTVTAAWWQYPIPVNDITPAPAGMVININTADTTTLQLLPGIGPKLAQAITDHREAFGDFQSLTQLDNVPRIGPNTIQRIQPWVRLSDQ